MVNTSNIQKKGQKNGCLTCRHRRKKCDEIKPRCSGCTRNLLTCKWPSSFNNECPQILESKGLSADQNYSFVHVPQEELSKSYASKSHTSKSKERVRNSGANRFQIVFSLSQLPDGKLCEVGEDGCRTLERFPRYQKRELASSQGKEQLKSETEDQVTANSDTICSRGEERSTSSSYENETGTADEKSHQFSDHQPIDIEHQSCVQNGESKKTEEHDILKTQYGSSVDDKHGALKTQYGPLVDDKHSYKDFFDLQLEPYIFLKENSLKNMPVTSENDLPKQPDAVSEIWETSMQTSSNGQDNSEVVFRSNYSFLNDDNNCAAEKYRKIIENYDQGEPVGNTGTENDEALLFYTCIKKFIPNLGTQDTHPLLTACATFIPQVENNMPLKEIFLCCGATYLEWYDDAKFSPLSDSLYKSSQMLIDKYLQENSPIYNGSWLLAAFQLLCLRSKMALSGTVDECVNCLSKSYLVIKNTIFMRNKDQNHIATGLQNLAYEIENKFMGQSAQDKLKGDLVLQPYERMYVESFIYNYSVSILFATDISQLPNPFSVFIELDHFLKCPLYYCYYEWMNNPVLGPALDAFEILAKVSYIGRFPMPLEESSIWYQRAQQLQTMAFFYTGPILSPQLKVENAEIFKKAKLSSLVGGIVAKSSYLLVSKILRYDDFQIQQPSTQKVRREIFEAFSAIPLENKIWGILLWPLIVTGCFSTAMPEKGFVLKYLLSVGEYFHHQSTIKIRSFLEKAWSRPEDKRLEILFDREELAKVAP